MDKGTSRNILTELNMTSDQYNFVTLAYYVSSRPLLLPRSSEVWLSDMKDTIHYSRDTFESLTEAHQTLSLECQNPGRPSTTSLATIYNTDLHRSHGALFYVAMPLSPMPEGSLPSEHSWVYLKRDCGLGCSSNYVTGIVRTRWPPGLFW
jgi:hypothetical protein